MTKNFRFLLIFLFIFALELPWGLAEQTPAPAQTTAPEPEQTSEPTLYLEFFWLHDSAPCEALLISPPHKIPLVIVRAYSKEQKPVALVAACGILTQSTESEEEILLTCSEPRVIWGKSGLENVVPEHFLITGKEYGAVAKGEKIEACLVKPVPTDKEEEIVKKYLPPEGSK